MGKKKRKKRNSRQRKPRPSQPKRQKQPYGFDFGCLPYAMALGAYEFPQQLGAAEVIGVGYGETQHPEFDRPLPSISLIARNEAPMLEAFHTFNDWAKVTDPDSLELTIVFRNSGGYLLGLSAEPKRMEQRCLGFDRGHNALLSTLTWCKPIDSVHPFLRKLRDYSRKPVAPFLLQGAIYHGKDTLELTEDSFEPISGLQPLLKFEATFADEAEVEQHTQAWIHLKAAEGGLSNSAAPTEPPTESPKAIAGRRFKALRTHFPVTIERLRMDHRSLPLVKTLGQEGIRTWQIEQAICNITLRRSAGSSDPYVGTSIEDITGWIAKELSSYYETANGDSKLVFDINGVRTQVVADGNALLKAIRRKEYSELAGTQEALHDAGALEAGAAICLIEN